VEREARTYAVLSRDLARALAEVERERAYLHHGFRSVQSWAESKGLGPSEIRRLLRLGRALLCSPPLEEEVRSGRIPNESAALLGQVLADPVLRERGIDESAWLQRARSLSPRSLRDVVRSAIENARQDELTVALRLQVTVRARDGFQSARRLLSRGKRRLISEGETFARVVEQFLEAEDPARRRLPRRKEGAGRGRGRYIPSRVRAEVERRSGGVCEICGERRAMEKMHLRVSHSKGGARSLENLADACHQCHLLADAGYYEFEGFDEARKPLWRAHPERLVRERSPPYGFAGRGPRRETASAQRRDDRLGFRVMVQRFASQFAAEAGLLEPSERRGGIVDVVGVDPDRTGA
jgi:hypothetical protein